MTVKKNNWIKSHVTGQETATVKVYAYITKEEYDRIEAIAKSKVPTMGSWTVDDELSSCLRSGIKDHIAFEEKYKED